MFSTPNTSIVHGPLVLLSRYSRSTKIEIFVLFNDHFVLERYFNRIYSTNRYVGIKLEPALARGVFPCVDQPDAKAVFRLTLTYPCGYTALSNTDPANKEVELG